MLPIAQKTTTPETTTHTHHKVEKMIETRNPHITHTQPTDIMLPHLTLRTECKTWDLMPRRFPNNPSRALTKNAAAMTHTQPMGRAHTRG